MIASAYLRSYLPESSLPTYDARPALPPGGLHGDQHFLWREPVIDDAFTVSWGSGTFICPRNSRLRMLEGMLAFNNAFPDAGLIPPQQIAEASSNLETLRESSPSMRSYILTSPWHVPVRWFTAFLHEERELYDRPAGLSIRYRTLMGDAKDRVERAVQVIAAAGFDQGIIGQLHSLETWLEQYPADGMLELDYDDVADLFPEGDLVLDESAADVAATLLSLEHDDMDLAGDHYQTLMRRWGPVQVRAFSN